MPGKAVKIGPFDDGLNNVSLAGEALDTQLVELINFEVGLDKSLQSRPPYKVVTGSSKTGQNGLWKILGIYRINSAQWYLIAVEPMPSNKFKITAYFRGNIESFLPIKEVTDIANIPSAYVQMDNFGYFSMGPASTISGFKWKGGPTGVTVATDIATMPKGSAMVAYKSRLWIAGNDAASSKLAFSTIDAGGYKPDVWAAADFLNVAPGEGGFITGLLALNSYILIFKNDGTWRFSYPSKPSTGQVDKVSGSIGTASSDTVVEFENYIYVYDQGKLYELVNNNFTQLNRFVSMQEDSLGTDTLAPGVSVSIFNRRIIVRYFNTTYAYSVDSRTWSQWRTVIGTPGKLYELPADSETTRPSTYICASAGTRNTAGIPDAQLITIEDSFESTSAIVEEFTCLMRTKSFDYQTASSFKRLFWWGVDMKTNLQMKATVIPVANVILPLWGDLEEYTHLELEQGTWGNPLVFKKNSIVIFDGGDPSNAQTENGRIFGKFIKSLRFRQVIYEVEMTSHGNLDTLAKVYSITTYVDPKAKVVDKFN